MESSSEEETEISESEMEECEADVYADLKEAGPRRVKYPNGSFRCPFCPGKKKREYIHSDLLQHAVACGATSPRSPRDRASHLALAKLLRTEYQPAGSDLPPHLFPEDVSIFTGSDGPKAWEDRFVSPWFGVLANLSTWIDPDTERWFGESGGAIKEKLELNGLHPVRIRPVYSESNAHRSHSGYALVAFASGWNGFADAMAFERHFDKNGRGKRDWVQNENVKPKGTVYGWVAREEDYFDDGAIGEQLRKNGDLRTLADLARAESKKNDLLVKELIDRIAAKDKLLEELGVTGDWKRVLVEMMKERDELRHALGKGTYYFRDRKAERIHEYGISIQQIIMKCPNVQKGYSRHSGTEFQPKGLEDLTLVDKFNTFSVDDNELQEKTTADDARRARSSSKSNVQDEQSKEDGDDE